MTETDLRDKTCFFSGHRDLKRSLYPEVLKKLEQVTERLIDRGVLYFGVGGAWGFDTLAALTVLKLRPRHPGVRLVLILPCQDHSIGWPGKDRELFEKIAGQADKIVYTAERYYSGCMYKRNRHMAEQSGWCVCYQERGTGGTAYAVSYAKSVGVRVINLADDSA